MIYMRRCGKRGIRYKKVIGRVKGMSMVLWEMFIYTVGLKQGRLVDGDGQGIDGLLNAWDATSGRTSISWSKAVAEEGTDDEGHAGVLG